MATSNEISNAFKEILPPSASASSSTPTKKVRYDVFINHRGPDTKETLAASIYDTLCRMGLQVFLDKPELELGDSIPSEIEKAMTTSFLHIAILSPKYAESPWCLAELSFMCKTGNKIIPVFYNVDPKDIHWICEGKGIYVDAFSNPKAKGRYTSETLQDWKRALQKVSYLSGYIVKNNDDEGKGKLLKAIKDYVEKQSQKIPLVVASHPVGLDEIVQDFERSVIHSFENVKTVGIVGMGGSGKTTLAKEYYNKTRFSIYKCSFIDNVRDVSKKDLYKKQEMMLRDLGFNDLLHDSVERGKSILAERLRSIQVFIILDDVDHQDQLESLLPMKDSLGQGSVIVVTSRDSDVLTRWGISSIYRMKELNPIHAMKLFCLHVFQQPSPTDGFENLVKKFLIVCKGLPLSLKILGGLVRGKSQEYWIAQLNKVSRVLHKDIKDTLKISFDALDEEEQEIFLDISCFFIREEKHLAIAVWDGSGWSGLHSLETLENKCLVELDERNRITMHDHLRDLGKEIALGNEITRRKSPYRLWSPQQISDIEIQGQESVLIRGIKAETDEFYEKFMDLVRESRRMFKRQLEILVVRNDYFTEELTTLSACLVWLRYISFLQRLFYRRNYFIEECSRLSAGLVWLRWVEFPHRSLPSWLSLKKLRILELHDAYELEELWSKTADPPVQLRELNISGAKSFLRFPSSIGCLQHLKKMTLNSTYSQTPIKVLPEEFCCLLSLEHLELIGCDKLKSLPSKFGDLTNLRHLDFRECRLLVMLPASFKHLIHLQHLYLRACSNLTFPPDILENMTKLETMDVNGCLKLQELPTQITNQGSLKKLDMGSTSLMKLPNNIGELSKLEALTIGSSLLKTLPPSMGNLSSLTSLRIYSCEKLGSLPDTLMQLASLHSLDIQDCPLTELAILSRCFSSSFYSLRSIEVHGTLVSRISISQQCCPSLEYLYLEFNDHLVEIDSLPISVKTIRLAFCKKLKNISGVSGLVNLENLVIKECGEELDELPSFAELVSLKIIEIRESAEQIQKRQGLENCRSLEKLIAHTWGKEPVVQSLENTESLRRVELSVWNISALEPCLQTIKKEKWPSECIICGRTAPGAEAVLKSLTFPGLTLVDSCVQLQIDSFSFLTLKCGQKHSSNAAVLFCFVVNSVSDDTRLNLRMDLLLDISRVRVKEGKWVWMGVFTQSSSYTWENKFELQKTSSNSNPYVDEDMGMLVMGEEKRVVEAFYQLLQHLGEVSR